MTGSRIQTTARQPHLVHSVVTAVFAGVLALSASGTALADFEEGHGASPLVGSGHGADQLLTGDIKVAQLFGAHPGFAQGYETFEPEPLELPEDLTVWLFFGTWCHDSQREVPRLLKLLEAAGLGDENLRLIGLDYRKREPRGRAAEFNVRYTPTAIFMRGDVEVGRIVERPNTSLYADIRSMFVEGG